MFAVPSLGLDLDSTCSGACRGGLKGPISITAFTSGLSFFRIPPDILKFARIYLVDRHRENVGQVSLMPLSLSLSIPARERARAELAGFL